MEIRIKYEKIISGAEMLAAYRAVKGETRGEDYDRMRILADLDLLLLKTFMADGAALLSMKAGGRIDGMAAGEEELGLIVASGCVAGAEREEMVGNIVESYFRHYVLARWYSKLGLAESRDEAMGRATALADRIAGELETTLRRSGVKIARRRRLPPF